MKRLALINIPSQELERPPAAAAALSACARNVGWDCKIFDFNLFLNSNVDTVTWRELEQYWRCKILSLPDSTKQKLDAVTDKFLNTIREFDPEMVGLSVFTRFSVIPAHYMLDQIKTKLNCKTLIGGSGIYAWPGSLPNLNTGYVEASTFAEFALTSGLVDYYIKGDGEVAIQELLRGNTSYPGINGSSPIQIRDLNVIPHPEYQGIDPLSYYYTHEPGIYITASRGCVRKCTFCNVPEMWPKFTVRTADDIVEEIIKGKKNYGVNLFHFTDSLINGDMKTWREVNEKLIIAKEKDSELKPIRYLGQFICRTREAQNEQDWELMARAGADLLVTGFESYSPHVRTHMGKHYSNDDIDFQIRQTAKYGIKNVALMFVGYPVETLEDHEYNLEFLRKFQKYAKAGVFHMVRWGYTGMFRDGLKLSKPGEVKLVTDPDFAKRFNGLPEGIRDIALGFGWINELNPTLTLNERIRRRIELHELSVKLGWPQTRNREELQILYNILSNLNQNIIDSNDFDDLDSLLDFH